MIEAALLLSGGNIQADVLDELITQVKEMLLAPVPLTLGVEETLAELAGVYPLMLITKGDLFEQERKIERSGIAEYFRYIEVVSEKTEASYRQALGKYRIDPTQFLMVGNSLKSDILPVLKLGGRAVYIPHDQTWHHETVSETEIGRWTYGQVERLTDLPAFIEGLFARLGREVGVNSRIFEPHMNKTKAHLRVARPTDNLEALLPFYQQGLGFEVIGSFKDHDGFDGVMLGHPGWQYHLEFTRKRGHISGRAPTKENLLIFYIPDPQAWKGAVQRMRDCGYLPLPALNPYWDVRGATFDDPDGYRVVLQNASWKNG